MDENLLYRLCGPLDHCAQETTSNSTHKLKHGQVHDYLIRNIPHKSRVRKVVCKKCTNKEFKFNTTITNFDMNSVILDLRSDVNILPKKL